MGTWGGRGSCSSESVTLQGPLSWALPDWMRGSLCPSSGVARGGDEGCLLLSGSGDRTIKVWSPENGRCIATLNGHTDSVRSVEGMTPSGL